MNILVANDDGIQARGLQELVKILCSCPDIKVYVCAPDGQRSAAGHGITTGKPVYLHETQVEGAEKAYSCSGLPADCVKLGLRAFEASGVEIDLVYSGINHGANLGSDTLYSGTVSAAMEGALCGKPAVAVSLCSHEPVHFESCHAIASQIAPIAMNFFGGSANCRQGVISINVPDLPMSQIKGIKAASVGDREYDDRFEPVHMEDGSMECGYSGEALFYEDLSTTVDVGAYQKGYITISPLHYDLTDYNKLSELEAVLGLRR